MSEAGVLGTLGLSFSVHLHSLVHQQVSHFRPHSCIVFLHWKQ